MLGITHALKDICRKICIASTGYQVELVVCCDSRLEHLEEAKTNNSAASRRDVFLKDEEYLGFERNKLIAEAMLLSCHLLSLFVCLFTAIIGVSYS